MTRKLTCNLALSLAASFIAILIVLTAETSAQPLFLSAVAYGSGGQYTTWVAAADVNGDGKPDLLMASLCASNSNCNQTGISSGTVSVLLGNGDGTFKTAVPYYAGGFGATSVAVADVNRDGKPDLLVSTCGDVGCKDPMVGVLLGNGDGTFQAAVLYRSGVPLGTVTAGDVNEDGKPDILIANSSTTVGVLLGNGDGTFQPAISYGSGGNGAGPIAVADVNGDGKQDLIVANACPTSDNGYCPYSVLGVLLGNGDGTFQTAVPYPSGAWGLPSVSVGDVNGDGKPDLVMSNSCVNYRNCSHGTVDVLIGAGDGTFRTIQTYSSGANWAVDVAVADVNADHKADLLVIDQCPTCANGKLGVLLGNGNGTFQPAVLYKTGGPRASSIAVEDVNGDGKPDVLVSNFCGNDCGAGTVGVLLAVRATTATHVTSSGSPSLINQPVTFTATVTSKYGPIPDGESVTFYDGTTAIGTGSTASGVAKFTTSSLTAKTHTIKATYAGDAAFKPSTGSVTQIVEKYPTVTNLTSNPNPSQFGQAVTFTAHVTSTGPAPTGKVKFLDGTTGIGLATLNGSGVAKLIKSTLAVGTHPITAQYLGDAASAKSTSSVVNQVVQ
jgi:hypothetical protein